MGSEEAADERLRLTEELLRLEGTGRVRASLEDAIGRAQVFVVEDVGAPGGEGEAVLARDALVHAAGTTAAAAESAAGKARRTPAKASATARSLLAFGEFGSDADDLAEAGVHADVGGAGAYSVGDDFLAGAVREDVETTELGLHGVRFAAAGGVGGARVELVVACEVSAGDDIKWSARVSYDHGRERDMPGEIEVAEEHDPIAHVKAGASVIEARIAGDRGNGAYSTGVALGVAVSVVGEQAELSVSGADGGHHLMLFVKAAGLIFKTIRGWFGDGSSGIDAIGGVRCGIKSGGAHVIGEVFVDTLGEDVGYVPGHSFG